MSAPHSPSLALFPGPLTLHVAADTPPVRFAVADLERDFEKVLGIRPGTAEPEDAAVCIEHDPRLGEEAWTVEIGGRVVIRGGDDLGMVYGIYEFSRRALGVDPFWFWRDREPEPRERLLLPRETWTSSPAPFRHRGWFLNDEDLIGRWRESGNERFRNWPSRRKFLEEADHDDYERRLLRYYTPIADPEVMEMVFEALLRMGGNLIIPASFVDILNPPEADLIRAAIRRGLYVSQHHVEPLGVSHFAYESWWGRQGTSPAFSYREEPEAMCACWRAYAERWHEIAGDRVIWQLGLRGRGDRPLWDHDPEAKARAGEFITAALEKQLSIVREVDPRPDAPATLTLWLEGADLIRDGSLRVPEGIQYIFADDHVSQNMREDFHTLPRDPGRKRGVYYHVGVWNLGPHLVQGVPPEQITREVRKVVAKGDTDYAILNVANLREHLLGVALWTECVARNPDRDPDSFVETWVPPGTVRAYRELFDLIPLLPPDLRLYDGCARTFLMMRINQLEHGGTLNDRFHRASGEDREQTCRNLTGAVKRLERLLAGLARDRGTIPQRDLAWVTANLEVQSAILLGLYRALLAFLREPVRPEDAVAALGEARSTMRRAETGRWEHWYRGDTKVHFSYLIERIESLRSPAPEN